MIMVLALIILENFVKYRGIATGIQYAGGMASGIFFPKSLLFLRDQYGFRGMLLITGGLLMHATLFSFLLKLSSSSKKHTSPKISSANGGPDLLVPNRVNDSALTNGATNNSCKDDERRSYSLSLLMFAQPMFYVIFCSAVTMHYTQHVFTSTSVDLAIDRGSNLRKAAFIPVTASASGILGRTLLPLLADTNYLGSRSLVMYCHFFLGLFMILLAQVSSFELLLLASLCGSMCFACGITMKTVLMADCVGIDAVGVCCGVAGLGILPLFIGDPWIVGFFRDSMGSYDNLYHLLGGLNIFVGLILCLGVCYQRKHLEGWKTYE
ncbi:monocarboxylate transporter 12-like [Ixodes scapularis]|uniref:monocarboxylate transporter 12-like n=1 Tax=Ixodes scapularis TaxID=6945 RepID=UPI001C384F14|nr:monocarboxylate transporter 12-like [Ixodes scapularis]